MTDEPRKPGEGDENLPDSTEEYLLGGIDEDLRPEPDPKPPVEEPPAEDPPPPSGPDSPDPVDEPETPDGPAPVEEPPAEVTPEPGEYVEQPTEEVFALEARLLEGDVPELDPILRAALLEGPDSEVSSAASGQPPETGEAEAPAPETEEGELPAEEDTGTQEWQQPEPDLVTAEHTREMAALAKSEVHEAIAMSKKTGEPWSPARPPVGGDFQEPAKRQHYWWRFMLATVIIVFSFAGATSASIIHFVDDIAADIKTPTLDLSDKLLPKSNGGPQTIAILGSDQRTGGGAAGGDPGRSDTTMLLRLDPDSGQIALMSIPRDLKVEIPGVGTDKFNAAYSYGGPELTIKTIKSLTGLDINHVINIDFQGFAEAIDAVGCVFIDVDRKYYHSNEGLPAELQYAEIDIEAGYQKLCGPDALEYARYRHTDTDLVRAARQQSLLGQVRARLSIGEVLKRNKELINAFTHNTDSDIGDKDQIFEILKLLFDSKDATVTDVEFPATLGPSYVTATPEEIQGAVEKFLGFEETPGPIGNLNQGSAGSGKKKSEEKARKQAEEKPVEGDGGELVDASQGGLDVAIGLDKEIKRKDFAVYYPKVLPPGTIYAEGSRTYHLRDPDKNAHGAYRMVMALQADDGLHYFGVQGIYGWEDPPILDAPYDEVTKGDRTFRVYPEGDRIGLVSWTEDGNLYWVSNSLLQTLTNDQMLGIAESTKAFTPDRKQ